jgi:hypothetical protein
VNVTDEQNPERSAEQEKREELRRQLDALRRRLTELAEGSGATADTPLHSVFPAWPLPEEMPDHFDWDAIEGELRRVVVGRLDTYEMNDLQKHIICVSLGMVTALANGAITTQQADRIDEIVGRLVDQLERQAERLKAAS